jgi:Phosphoenolpyruvate hydrolase-like
MQSGRPVIGAGAGTGISAKCIEAGGAGLIIIYSSGRFRMAGRGSLAGLMPYGDANAVVVDMAGGGPAHRLQDGSARQRVRYRSHPRHGPVSRGAEADGVLRSAEFPDGRADRWDLLRESGGDGHGL